MRIICLSLLTLQLGACATVTRGTSQDFQVVTEPPGAVVSTTLTDSSGQALGCAPTPCTIEVPRRSEFIVRIDHEGHQGLRIAVRPTSDTDAASLNTLGLGVGATGAVAADTTIALVSFGTAFWASGTALVVGAPLFFVDASTGALSTVTPNPINVELLPLDEGVEPVHFVDPQALPSAVEAQALAEALATLEQRRGGGMDESVTAIEAEMEAWSVRYDRQCKVQGMRTDRPAASQATCRALRDERRELKSRWAQAVLDAQASATE